MTITLNETQRSLVANGLRLAATRYDEDAEYLRKTKPAQPTEAHKLIEVFTNQARDSRYLATLLEDADAVTIAHTHSFPTSQSICEVCGAAREVQS